MSDPSANPEILAAVEDAVKPSAPPDPDVVNQIIMAKTIEDATAIIQKVGLDNVKAALEPEPFYQRSEFWMVVLAVVGGVGVTAVFAPAALVYTVPVAIGAASAYSVNRSGVKKETANALAGVATEIFKTVLVRK